MLLEYDPADPAAFPPRLEQLADDPDRHVALPALPVARPRARERRRPDAARSRRSSGALALVGDDEGPWIAAMLHTQPRRPDDATRRHRGGRRARPRRAAGDGAAGGDGRRRPAARAARPLRDRRGAARGRRGRARATSTRSTTAGPCSAGSPSGRSAPPSSRWPAATIEAGLRLYRECAAALRGAAAAGDRADRPGAVGLLGESIALAAHAYHATTDADDAVRPRGCSRPAASASCACSTRRTRISTTRSPAWRCSGSAPGACCATRRRSTTRSAARPRRALRLQPDDARRWRGSGSRRRPRSAPRAGSPRCATSSATGGRRSCSTRRTASSSGSAG